MASPFSKFLLQKYKIFLAVIFRITITFIQTKIRIMSESTLKFEEKSVSVLSLKLKPRQTPEAASYWEVNGDLPWTGGEASVHGLHQWNWTEEHSKHLPQAAAPSKQDQVHTETCSLQSKITSFSLHSFPRSKDMHLQHSLQDPAAALLPSPINCALWCNSHTGRQDNCNANWQSQRNPLGKYILVNFKDRANLNLIVEWRSTKWD